MDTILIEGTHKLNLTKKLRPKNGLVHLASRQEFTRSHIVPLYSAMKESIKLAEKKYHSTRHQVVTQINTLSVKKYTMKRCGKLE